MELRTHEHHFTGKGAIRPRLLCFCKVDHSQVSLPERWEQEDWRDSMRTRASAQQRRRLLKE